MNPARFLVPLLLLVIAVLSGCSTRYSPEWTAIRAGKNAQLYRRDSCQEGSRAVLRSYGRGYLVHEFRPGDDHEWVWLGVEPGSPGTYYLADGLDTWGTARSIAEVRRRHGYDAPKVLITPYRPAEVYPIRHTGAYR